MGMMSIRTIEAAKYSLKALITLLKLYSLIGLLFLTEPRDLFACATIFILLAIVDRCQATKSSLSDTKCSQRSAL